MSAWPNWWAIGGGALASNLILGGLLHWVRAVVEINKSRTAPGVSRSSFASQLVLGSLLNAGPWTLLAAAYLSYYISSQPWASSFYAGAVGWMAYFGALMLYGMWRVRRMRGKDAL